MKRLHKILLIAILPLALLFAVSLTKILIIKQLDKVINHGEDRIYNYELGDFKLDFFARKLTLRDIKIKPRIRRLDSLKQIKKARSTVYSILAAEIAIQDLNPLEFLFSKKIRIGKIQLISPNVTLYKADTSISDKIETDSSISNEKQLFSDLFSENFKEIKLQEIQIKGAESKAFRVHQNDTQLIMRSDTAHFHVYGLETDQELIKSQKIFLYDSSSFELRSTHWEEFEDYVLHLNELKKTTEKDHLIFKGVKISPREDKYSFMKHKKVEDDWFKIEIDKMSIFHFDIKAFQEEKSLKSSNISIQGAQIEIYRDKRLRDRQSKKKPLPGSLLKNLKNELLILSLQIENSTLDYYEWEIDAKAPIHAEFDSIEFKLDNLSNNSARLQSNDTLKLSASADFMHSGLLSLDGEFYLNDHTDRFIMTIMLKDIPLRALNPILKESAFIEFKDGQLDWLKMNIDANNYRSTGILDLKYSGMKHIDLLRKMSEMDEHIKKGHDANRKRKFLSFILSGILPKDYGPEKPNYKQAKITIDRNHNRSVINYLVENLKTGARAHFEF